MTIAHGTRVETNGFPSIGGFAAVAPETARIVRWRPKVNGERMEGWHIIKFDCDGGMLCMHESRFRVIDNRA